MKRTTAAILIGAAGVVVGAGGLGTLALWNDTISIQSDLTTGHIHFAAGDPVVRPADLPAVTAENPTVTWSLPDGGDRPGDVLGDLGPGAPQAAVVQVDAQSQGNRGLSYAMAVSRVDDSALLEHATVSIVTVERPTDCVPGVTAGAGTLYTGPVADAAVTWRELVPTDYTTTPWTSPETEYLCLDVAVPDDPGAHENTGTVTATADGGLEDDRTLEASSTGHATAEPDAADHDAVVEFEFSHTTYRPGEAP